MKEDQPLRPEQWLKTLKPSDAIEFIRNLRYPNKQSFNFDESVSNNGHSGHLKVKRYNRSILDKYTCFGIYDYGHFTDLSFHKGTPIVVYNDGKEYVEEQLGGSTTSEIIYRIFELAIFPQLKGIEVY